MSEPMTLKRAALYYASIGLPVFPLVPRGKKPLTEHGFKDATTDQQQIAQWWDAAPDANIGMPTAGLLVLDADPRHGAPKTRDELIEQLGPWPDTAEQITGGGGRHILFRYTGGKVPQQLGKGLELKTNGSYIVVAPSIHESGNAYCWDGLDLKHALLHPADAPQWLLDRIGKSRNGAETIAASEEEKWLPGTRNTRLASLAGKMRRSGLSQSEMQAALAEANEHRCDPPLPHEEVRTIARSYARYRPGEEPQMPAPRPPEASQTPPETAGAQEPEQPAGIPELLYQPLTDTGNAERLVALFGRDIRFCYESKKWLVWDGRRWNSEDTRRVKAFAKQTVRQLYAQAAGIDNADIKEAAEKHARKSESAGAINSMLACAEYETGIPVSANDLDQQRYLLNVQNGTLDLSTGQLRAHRRDDLLTKLVHFEFEPTATCPQFIGFLRHIMGGGPDASEPDNDRAERLMAYIQKCLGSALTGDVRDKAVFCFFGGTDCGKTTLLEAIRFVISEYAAQILIENLMHHDSRETNTSLADLSALCGARFVTTSEADKGQRLAIGKLKYLTQGMGAIKACRKYENPIEFTATHKLFLDANDKPVVRGIDKAIWNRLKPIPFTVAIAPENIDRSLPEKLQKESAGILAWMVEGCRRWLSEGLGDPPEEVTAASEQWKSESDRFSSFLDEKCVRAGGVEALVSQLWPSYQAWCESNNERHSLSKSEFDERLKKLGCEPGLSKDRKSRVWKGIRFRTPADDDTDN